MNHNDGISAIAKCEPFEAGNFRGFIQTYFEYDGEYAGLRRVDQPSFSSHTRMSIRDHSEMQCYLNAGAVDYVVLSYQTPIAYHTVTDGWIVCTKKHSATTSKHTNYVRRAIGVI